MTTEREHMHEMLAACHPCWFKGRPVVKIELEIVRGAEMFKAMELQAKQGASPPSPTTIESLLPEQYADPQKSGLKVRPLRLIN